MLIINSNLINLIGGSGKCQCYGQNGQDLTKGTISAEDSEQCYRYCCTEPKINEYEYTSRGLSFWHSCNETVLMRFEKNARILRDVSHI